MGRTIDIDTGGTFTDGFFVRDDEIRTVKTLTTPHDLTVCFLECIEAGARAFGLPVDDLLYDTELVRFSTTIGTNCIIERNGTKLGLIVSGEDDAPPTATDSGGKKPLVAPDMVIAIHESTDREGRIGRAPDSFEVLDAAQTLVDCGARCLVVALANSDANPQNERRVRDIIRREYPRDFLGSVPVFLASDVSRRPGRPERVNAAVLNAYIHDKLARLLYRAGEELRRREYRGPLLIGHNNGAVARVAKTRAIDTYNSGPAAGLLGTREIGALYGSRCVISADMGGTSFDLGYVLDGEPSYALRPDVEGFHTNLPMLAIRALGAGGGSIAVVHEGSLTVGPRSAGALPGPACFDLGGVEATVTDANVVLGFLDPDSFLGGRKRLDPEKARAAIDVRVARPLGISVEQAALRIRETVEDRVAQAIAGLRAEIGPAVEPLMLLYGGAGPLHGCAIAERAGIGRIVVTPFSAVFSAYASSLMDVGHLYSGRTDVALEVGADFSPVAEVVASLRRRAEQDMRGEGFARDRLSWSLELIVEADGREARVAAAPDFHCDADGVADVLARAIRRLPSRTNGISIRSVGVFARAPVPHFAMRRFPPTTAPLADAIGRPRTVYLGEHARAVATPVYTRRRLACAHRLAGPALVESDETTIFAAPGWTLAIDEFLNAVLEREEGS
jgi:N-methylhydantoinase A/acetophenone carboxylase